MATYRIFCYNPTGATISGTEQVGNIAAATGDVSIDPTKQWWNGPDEDVRYIVAYSSLNSERSNGPERVLATNYPCNLGFIGSLDKTDESFLNLAKTISGSSSLASASAAKTWLNTNGYWTSWTTSYGSLTTAWIAATGETDLTILGALNTLESDLTTYGLTSKMKALYPMVGGTAGKHSYNFMNTAQYQITWSGGLTHSSTGVLPNGVNGFGFWNTVLTSSLGLLPNNLHISSYVRTNNVSTNAFEIQIKDNGGNNHVLQAKNPNNNSAMYGFTGGSTIAVANADSRGFYIGGATSSSSTKFYKNGTLIGSSSGAQSTFPGIYMDLTLFGSYSGGATREQAFASLGTGLTDTEAANFYTAVQAFQTTLGRQV